MADEPSDLTAVAQAAGNVLLTWVNNESYSSLIVYRKPSGGSYSLLETVGDTDTTYTDTSTSTNTTYYWKVFGGGFGFSNEDSCTRWSNTVTETSNVSESKTTSGTDKNLELSASSDIGVESQFLSSESVNYSDTITDTVTVTDTVLSSQSIHTNEKHYLGSSDGDVFLYDPIYLADDSVAIPVYWQSKGTDFSDQYVDLASAWKTIDCVALHYVDKNSHDVMLSLSTDNGASWEDQTKTIGSGDECVKTTYFHFRTTGRYFSFRLKNVSSTEDIQWVGMTVYFEPHSKMFHVSV